MFMAMSQSAMVGPPGGGLMSLADWAGMPEDEPGELVDGQLVEEEEADYPHEAVVSWIQYFLTGWTLARGGAVFGSEAKYAVGPGRVEPRLRMVEILELGRTGHHAQVLSAAEGVVDVPGCEGLKLDLDALWRRKDALWRRKDELVEAEPDAEPRR
jgi:hypothetical protein